MDEFPIPPLLEATCASKNSFGVIIDSFNTCATPPPGMGSKTGKENCLQGGLADFGWVSVGWVGRRTPPPRSICRWVLQRGRVDLVLGLGGGGRVESVVHGVDPNSNFLFQLKKG